MKKCNGNLPSRAGPIQTVETKLWREFGSSTTVQWGNSYGIPRGGSYLIQMGRGRGRGGGLHEACDLGVYVRIVFDNSKDMDYSLV